jgi:hypothetical protein
MDHERRRRVTRLFHAAPEREPEARQAFLEVACAGDTDLWRQVEPLLAKAEQAGSLPFAVEGAPAPSNATSAPNRPLTSSQPDAIGRHRKRAKSC